jgi:hypothetical protein
MNERRCDGFSGSSMSGYIRSRRLRLPLPRSPNSGTANEA